MDESREVDQPLIIRRDDGTEVRSPANFEAMTPEQRRGWPDRAYKRWRRRRLPLLVIPLAVGLLVGWLARSPAVGVGVAGLGLDILGAWLLVEAVLMTDEEARAFGTYVGLGSRGDLAMRDRRQAVFAMSVLTAGFIGQLFNLLLSVWSR